MPRATIVRALWRRAKWYDRAAAILIAAYVLVRASRALGWNPAPGALPAALFFLPLLSFAAIVFLLIRSRRWIAARLLWKLRNRLIFAYIFIAVVPVVLLVTMGGILAYLADIEVAAHLLHDDFHDRMLAVSAVSREALALAQQVPGPPSALASLSDSAPMRAFVNSLQRRLPGLTIEFSPASPATDAAASPAGPAEFVEREGRLWIEAGAAGPLADSRAVKARARLPVTSRLLDGLSSELGPLTLGAATPISSQHRALSPPRNWFDLRIVGVTTFDAVRYSGPGTRPVAITLPAGFSLRLSSLSRHIASSLGEFEWVSVVLLALVGGLFVVLWLLAFIAGMVLTSTITRTVASLDEATHHVKAGDFTHRISIARHDQLGALAESFNSMTGSIEELLEGQRQRQRLENELSIAREVQAELFPRSLPAIAGLDLGAVCRAARIVSGDYYDCLQIDAHRVAIALADISGKGISAALLMANLNAALRSLVIFDGARGLDTATLAHRLNRHLLLNTSDDRYATLFFAVYDTAARRLDYTNAGHLPPFFITKDRVERLDRGGPVIGLLDDCRYEQASIEVEPGCLLVAYSDGMTEPEDAYGEEFGSHRLVSEILRHRDEPPGRLCATLLEAVGNWCAPAEPFDDQTVLVARMA